MISSKVTIPPSLLKKLDSRKLEKDVEKFVKKTGQDAVDNVREFGLGVGSVYPPEGGAPHWQGKITHAGHYSGYLSDIHYMIMSSSNNAQILSEAEFVWGVIEGYSTNEPGKTFPPNYYHKRAVDKLYKTNLYGNKFQENWKDVRQQGTSW